MIPCDVIQDVLEDAQIDITRAASIMRRDSRTVDDYIKGRKPIPSQDFENLIVKLDLYDDYKGWIS